VVSGSDRALKRLFDILLSASGLILSSPLWLLIALAIKAEDGGPVFYGHKRVGKDGRLFRAYKFRSMIPDAEREVGPIQAAYDDPRVTRVGRILRGSAMDELPQLWSILKGDMSFVGPRALRPREIEVNGAGGAISLKSIPGYQERLRVQPGLTGIAQVYAPRNLGRHCKFRYDLLYIRRQSLWLDLRLILASFWITARRKWESEEDKI
jgi:lipopolysaccharide/colanic/teichoic acid biosynthesis glycosyltransferase